MLSIDVLNEIKAISSVGKGFEFGDYVSIHFRSILEHGLIVHLGTQEFALWKLRWSQDSQLGINAN